MTAKELARKLAGDLFTNGAGEKADRLALMQGPRDLGGWGLPPFLDQIESAILSAIAEERERILAVADKELCMMSRSCLKRLKAAIREASA